MATFFPVKLSPTLPKASLGTFALYSIISFSLTYVSLGIPFKDTTKLLLLPPSSNILKYFPSTKSSFLDWDLTPFIKYWSSIFSTLIVKLSKSLLGSVEEVLIIL